MIALRSKTFTAIFILPLFLWATVTWGQSNGSLPEGKSPDEIGKQDPVVENNLFAPTRTPPSTSKTEDKPQQISPGDLQLDGVILAGDKKRAIFKVNPNILRDEKAKKNPYITVSEGEQVGAYKIVSIKKDQVVVDQNGQQVVIPLIKSTKTPSPITVALPTVSLAPVQQPQSSKPQQVPSNQPQPQPQPQPAPPEGAMAVEAPPGVQPQPQPPSPSPFPPHNVQPVGEEASVQPPLPSPEDFEKLNPEEKERVIQKMQKAMDSKIKSNIKK